jgi:hypothetical protein
MRLLPLVMMWPAYGNTADNLWYCKELDSAGLRFHYGIWTQQRFKVASHAVRQRGYTLELTNFGMVDKATDCSFDYSASIISCTDRYTLFNLNINNGRAALAYGLGWVHGDSEESSAANDLSVSALQCIKLIDNDVDSP